jgi:hypothetical protein
MTDIITRAREVVDHAGDGASASPGLVADLLTALEKVEAERDDLAETLMHTQDSHELFKGLFRDAAAERDEARAEVERLKGVLDQVAENGDDGWEAVYQLGWEHGFEDPRRPARLTADLDTARATIREMAKSVVRLERVRDIGAYGGDDPDSDHIDYMAIPCMDVMRAASSEVTDDEAERVAQVWEA